MTVELPREPIHSPFGGSVAARVLHCPASVGLIEKVPAYLRKVSAYADRGTALHEAMALVLDEAYSLDDLVGKTFGTYTITHDDIANALQPAFAYVVALLDTPGAEFFLEARITFPTVAGAFGTADLIVRIGRTVHVIDLKFGVGVRVLALSPADDDPAVDVINGQLLFYAAAAPVSCPPIRDGTQISACRETAGGGLAKGRRETLESSGSPTILPSARLLFLPRNG